MNKRATKRAKARAAELTRSLEIGQTALALTNGLADDEFAAQMSAERAELGVILDELGWAPVAIGCSHQVIVAAEEHLMDVVEKYAKR